MHDLRLVAAPPRPELQRAISSRLGDIVPGWQPLAEGLLGAEATIDLVGAERDGRTVLVLIGDSGDDLSLIARGLAQQSWIEPRVRDWLQLAPKLPVQPNSDVLAVLLCPSFRPEAILAARAAGANGFVLATYRFLHDGTGLIPLLERVDSPAPADPAPTPDPAPRVAPAPFRTGLTDADLGLSNEEQSEFE